MRRNGVVVVALAAAAPWGACAWASDPWADQVVSYQAGAGVDPRFADPVAALGEPTRFSNDPTYPSVVSPFSPAFVEGDIVSIGAGGSLTLRFNEPVTNDAAHPYGIDLLIFGNAGYLDDDYPHGVAGPLWGNGGGTVEVSADGSNWVSAPGVAADGAFPTLGYLDVTDPYSPVPGAAPSDFTRPVNPAFNAAGLSFSQIVAGYAGSGGGAGVDIGALGLAAISYVRISTPAGAAGTVEIDGVSAVSAVPGPSGALAIGAGALRLIHRRRRR